GFENAGRSRFGVKELERRIVLIRSNPEARSLDVSVEHLATTLDSLRDRSDEPGGLVHSDLFRDNVLWQDGRISALLDFESASHETSSFDVMVTLLAWCFHTSLDRELSRALIRGYTGVRPFTEGERARLFDDARFAALRFSITRITDFELRPKGTGIYKDFRR